MEDIQQIRVPAVRKTMQSVSIPYYGLLKSVFENAKENDGGQEYVFPEARRLYKEGRTYVFTDRLKSVLKASGFTKEGGEETAIQGKQDFQRRRRACLRGFPSFKTTWVSLALIGGIPISVVQHITGNQVTEIVMKHYFNPDVNSMRKLVEEKMPGLLTEGQQPANKKTPSLEVLPVNPLLQVVLSMDADNWRVKKAELLQLLEAAGRR